MAVDPPVPAPINEPPREPTLEDLVKLCRLLHQHRASFIVVGGFAVRACGIIRGTMAVDLLIDPAPDNEARVFKALESLPDGCARELDPGDVARFAVVRVADEIIVDLMAHASGIGCEEAAKDVIVREVDGISIPFAGPELLCRMKKRANREKDRGDIFFLDQMLRSKSAP